MTGLEAQGLTLAYDRRGMVEGLTLALPAGRGAAILGPNGCGWPRLLKALAERALRGGQAPGALAAPLPAPLRGKGAIASLSSDAAARGGRFGKRGGSCCCGAPAERRGPAEACRRRGARARGAAAPPGRAPVSRTEGSRP